MANFKTNKGPIFGKFINIPVPTESLRIQSTPEYNNVVINSTNIENSLDNEL